MQASRESACAQLMEEGRLWRDEEGSDVVRAMSQKMILSVVVKMDLSGAMWLTSRSERKKL